jgi:hypothetical protein
MSWKRFLTQGMRKDLEFYLKHDKELYFKGMALIAISWLMILATGVYILFVGDMIGLVMALFGALGFGIVKMYLHIRKDAIEIKEQMMLCGWDHK